MSAPSLQSFQEQVSELLLRHRSLLDVMSKNGQSSSSVNRAVTKSITECGCIQLYAKKQKFGSNLQQAKENSTNHVHGQLCEHCREAISSELGRNLFYISALCSQLGINLDDVLQKESEKCSTLGLFNLS
ncbi:DUF1573 domain-containing protein [Paenibacillus sediminis]|uniref:DUF1573 domain-containing protein n=1 Tax=Paenibacillus sediminis TaxID=664909 RepID=A0ABS4H7F2_9BACL|nr:DUF1573 domain-containing protein [Paenibacillus sediminis]MBP1938406.1 hypothetical protein [Paenibacillus sediminis]